MSEGICVRSSVRMQSWTRNKLVVQDEKVVMRRRYRGRVAGERKIRGESVKETKRGDCGVFFRLSQRKKKKWSDNSF